MPESKKYPADEFLEIEKMMTPEILLYLDREMQFFKSEIPEGSKVLEVGCGDGRLLIPLAVHVGEKGSVVGIDNDERMCELAGRNAAVLKNACVRKIDAREMNPENVGGDYNYVVMGFNFLGNLSPGKQRMVLARSRNLLGNDGAVLASVYSERAAPDQLKFYYGLFPNSDFHIHKKYIRISAIDLASRRFSLGKIRSRFSHAGYSQIDARKLTDIAHGVRAYA